MQPSPNGSNGRDSGGRFVKGNGGGPGNPYARRVARLRSALFKAVTPEDIREVVTALLNSAKGGDVSAARELLQRLLGPPEAVDLMQRLDVLEQQLGQLGQGRSNT